MTIIITPKIVTSLSGKEVDCKRANLGKSIYHINPKYLERIIYTNRVDPNRTAPEEPFDLDLHC